MVVDVTPGRNRFPSISIEEAYDIAMDEIDNIYNEACMDITSHYRFFSETGYILEAGGLASKVKEFISRMVDSIMGFFRKLKNKIAGLFKKKQKTVQSVTADAKKKKKAEETGAKEEEKPAEEAAPNVSPEEAKKAEAEVNQMEAEVKKVEQEGNREADSCGNNPEKAKQIMNDQKSKLNGFMTRAKGIWSRLTGGRKKSEDKPGADKQSSNEEKKPAEEEKK